MKLKDWQQPYLTRNGAKWRVEVEGLEDEARSFGKQADAERYLTNLTTGISPPRDGRTWRARIDTTGGRRSMSYPSLAAAVRGRRADLAVLEEAKAVGKCLRPEANETFAQAVKRCCQIQRADGYSQWRDRLHRLERYALPALGRMLPHRITPAHLEEALARMVKVHGKSVQSAKHMRSDFRSVFTQLVRERLIEKTPAIGLALPRVVEVRRERATVDDHEFSVYMAYVPATRRHAVREVQIMAMVSRCLGGQRTGDLHALDWSHFDLPGFGWAWISRKKTARPQRMAVPEALRPYLREWWDLHHQRAKGPLFPVLKKRRKSRNDPLRVNMEKGKVSHAQALRRDLQAAFNAWNDAQRQPPAPKPGESRWRELFEEQEFTRPVDFHSFRRAYAQALAAAGVNEQMAMALTGHSSASVHALYAQSRARSAEVPDAALPRLTRPAPRLHPASVSAAQCVNASNLRTREGHKTSVSIH